MRLAPQKAPLVYATKRAWISMFVLFCFVFPDVALALPSTSENNVDQRSISEKLESAYEGYKLAYSTQDNTFIFSTFKKIEVQFSEADLQKHEALSRVHVSTGYFKEVHDLLAGVANRKLKIYNDKKKPEDQIHLEDITSFQMLMASFREEALTGRDRSFSMVKDLYRGMSKKDGLEEEHNDLYDLFKSLYKTAMGHAMTTHRYLLNLDVPDNMSIKKWDEEVRKKLVSTYCDPAPDFLVDKGMELVDSMGPPMNNLINCITLAQNVIETHHKREQLSIDEAAKELNQEIEKTNQALSQARDFGTNSTKLRRNHAIYETSYFEMFNATPGVLLLTDTLQGVHPYRVYGEDFYANTREDPGMLASMMEGFSRFAETTKYAYTALTDQAKSKMGKVETLQAMDQIQNEAVNPMYLMNHIVNPNQYDPRPLLYHNTQDTSTKEGLNRMRLAVQEALEETSSGLRLLNKTFHAFAKKYQTTPTQSSIKEALDLAVLHSVNKDLKKGIQEMTAYYTSAAIELVKTNPKAVVPIVESMVDEAISTQNKRERQKIIGTVMLVVAGILIVSGVAAGIGAGLAVAGSATAVGFAVVAKTALGVGFVVGATDAIYMGRQAYLSYRHYERVKFATYADLKKTHPYSYREEYDKYVSDLTLAVLAGVFTAVDLAALTNLKNIKNFASRAAQRSAKPEPVQEAAVAGRVDSPNQTNTTRSLEKNVLPTRPRPDTQPVVISTDEHALQYLNQQEFDAIIAYSRTNSKTWNKHLWGKGTLTDPQCVGCLEAISALEKLPSYNGRVFSGIQINNPENLAIIKSLKSGDEFVNKGFLSSSRQKEKSYFNHRGDALGDNWINFIIDSKAGKSIEFSSTPFEQEVLFSPGSQFKVKKVEYLGENKGYTIHLEEIEKTLPTNHSSTRAYSSPDIDYPIAGRGDASRHNIESAQTLLQEKFGSNYKVLAYDEGWSSVIVEKPNGKFQKAYYFESDSKKIIEFEGDEFTSIVDGFTHWSKQGNRIVKEISMGDMQKITIKTQPYEISLVQGNDIITIRKSDISDALFEKAITSTSIGTKTNKEGVFIWIDDDLIHINQSGIVLTGIRSGSDIVFTGSQGNKVVFSVSDDPIFGIRDAQWGRATEWEIVAPKGDRSLLKTPSALDDAVPASGYGEINCTGHAFSADAFLAKSAKGRACALGDEYFTQTVKTSDHDGILPTKNLKEAEAYYGAKHQKFFKPQTLHDHLMKMEEGGTAIVIVPPNPPRIVTGHMLNARKEGSIVVYYDFQKRVVTDNIEVYFNVGPLDRSKKAAYVVETTQYHKNLNASGMQNGANVQDKMMDFKKKIDAEGITEDQIKKFPVVINSRTNHPKTRLHIYETKKGEKWLLKEIYPDEIAKEQAAFVMSEKMGLHFVPEVSQVRVGDKMYSVHEWIDNPFINVQAPNGSITKQDALLVYDIDFPDDLLVYDFLGANLDRSKTGNLILQLPAGYNETVRLGTTKPPIPEGSKLWAIDHEISFNEYNPENLLKAMQSKTFHNITLDQFEGALHNSSTLITKIESWTVDQIQKDLGHLLKQRDIDALIERRQFLIDTYHELQKRGTLRNNPSSNHTRVAEPRPQSASNEFFQSYPHTHRPVETSARDIQALFDEATPMHLLGDNFSRFIR